jgi:hypothetical protein
MTKPFNIHDWQDKQRHLVEQRDDWTPPPMGMGPGDKPSQESMSNADIKALQKIVGDYSLNKTLNTIAVIADKVGKYDEADMIKKLASKIQDFEDEDENNDMNLAHDDVRDYNSERDFLPLQEHSVTFTKDDMVTLHNNGELIKADDDGKEHTYIFDDEQGNSDKDFNDWANDEYLEEEELDEQNTVGTGASFIPGNSPAYATPKAFGDDKKKKLKSYKNIGYKEI